MLVKVFEGIFVSVMDISLLSFDNSDKLSTHRTDSFYSNIEKDLNLIFLQEGLFLKEYKFPVYYDKLSLLFPFSGLLDIQENFIDVEPEEILFLDLEALGLQFTTSNYPFLIGFGYYQNQKFHIRQYLLMDLTYEEQYLNYIEEFIKSFKYIATFNGKKFDLPLLKYRFNMCDKKWEFSFHHFDIYVIWKRLLDKNFKGGFSQKNLEMKILNFFREDDIDGSRVPQIFFDWQKYKKYDEFIKIIQHNMLDVYNLFFLFIEALDLIKNYKKINDTTLPISKIFYRNTFYNESIELLETYNPKNQDETIMKNTILYKCYYKKADYDNSIKYLKKLIDMKKNPREILLLIRILQNKLKDYKQSIYYIDLLIDLIKNHQIETKNPFLQINSLIKRRDKVLKSI